VYTSPRTTRAQHAGHVQYEVVRAVAVGDYYPEKSREAGEEGPVVLEFTLRGKAEHPRDIKVVGSSLFPASDEAAAKALGDMVMSSSCKNAKYRLKLSFRLQQ
jgi:TonB family protein